MDTAETLPEDRRMAVGNWVVMLLFVALTALGVAVSAGLVGGKLLTTSMDAAAGRLGVPLSVYLYATLGAFGYIFTRLMTSLEAMDELGELDVLAKLGMRVPAAWVLAAGVYLLGGAVVEPGVGTKQLVTGVPFLVGLYVNVAFKTLGQVADRLLGRGRREAADS